MTINRELYIGLMSGTSVDGIDAVVAAIDAHRIELVASCTQSIPDEIRERILKVCNKPHITLSSIGELDHELGKLYATAVEKLLDQSDLTAKDIIAIGNHGQTVFHQPVGNSPFTMQLGDANIIAATTGIDTIADFRRMDMAVGGQGAPLVPAFHQYLFAARDSTTVVVNIGGIANITVIPVTGDVVGFDTGPGNLLMDLWCVMNIGEKYDRDGQWAKQGQTNSELLSRLMADSYLDAPPPKSTGRERYNKTWLTAQLESHTTRDLSPKDVQRTLCEYTAQSIALQTKAYTEGAACELLVCGGGANNPLLMELLQHHLPDWRVLPTSFYGVSVDTMEAMAFAWLARQRVHNLPGNLPAVTGATRKVSLGVFYPAIKEYS